MSLASTVSLLNLTSGIITRNVHIEQNLYRATRGMHPAPIVHPCCVCVTKHLANLKLLIFFAHFSACIRITHDTRPPTVLSWASVYLPQCACDAQPCKFEHFLFQKQTVYSTIIMCKPAYVVHIHLTRASPNKCSTLTSFEKPEVIANKIFKNLVYNRF